jgi:hypothetical protein
LCVAALFCNDLIFKGGPSVVLCIDHDRSASQARGGSMIGPSPWICVKSGTMRPYYAVRAANDDALVCSIVVWILDIAASGASTSAAAIAAIAASGRQQRDGFLRQSASEGAHAPNPSTPWRTGKPSRAPSPNL